MLSRFMGKREEVVEVPQAYQVKSSWYYIFWGICTVAVCAGQLYVGTGYREMADAYRENTDFMRGTAERILPPW